MKQIIKFTTAVIAIGTVTFFSACNNNGSAKTETTDSTKLEATHNGDHVFACPMHPEVTGKEGDTCPKCGMKLEHNDNAAAPTHVAMQFSTNPATVNPNEVYFFCMFYIQGNLFSSIIFFLWRHY